MRQFIHEFNDTQLLNQYFNETGDRLAAMKEFSKINVYVSDAEVETQRFHCLRVDYVYIPTAPS